MLFRIDIERFLTHMIDHFTMDDILSMEYAIISAGVKCGGRAGNMAKISILHPSGASSDIIETYDKYQDKAILRKMYFEYLKEYENRLYLIFVSPVLNHQNICIICCERENYYIDILVEYLEEKFRIECIDLNKLFIKGRVGRLYIDRDLIHDKAVDIRRAAAKDNLKALESSKDGMLQLLGIMSKKEKIKVLKKRGIQTNKSDYKDLDQLLMEEWVEDE